MTLDLNDQQVAYVMQTLAQRPYGEVADLIAVIHRQASAQAYQAARSPSPEINEDVKCRSAPSNGTAVDSQFPSD